VGSFFVVFLSPASGEFFIVVSFKRKIFLTPRGFAGLIFFVDGFSHILVDGWNAIHAHPGLARILAAGGAEKAQARLFEMLAPVHDFGGARLTIVYDGVGEEISIVRRTPSKTYSEVYTPSNMTADELIEQLCATSKRPQELLAVTRDNLLRLTASSFGVCSATPESFFARALRSRGEMAASIKIACALAEKAWKKSSPFAKLDELALDIKSALNAAPLVSKRMKKKLRKTSRERAESGQGEPAEIPSKRRSAAAQKNKPSPAETPAKAPAKPAEAPAKPAAPSRRRPIIGGKPASEKSLRELKNIFETRAKPRKAKDKK